MILLSFRTWTSLVNCYFTPMWCSEVKIPCQSRIYPGTSSSLLKIRLLPLLNSILSRYENYKDQTNSAFLFLTLRWWFGKSYISILNISMELMTAVGVAAVPAKRFKFQHLLIVIFKIDVSGQRNPQSFEWAPSSVPLIIDSIRMPVVWSHRTGSVAALSQSHSGSHDVIFVACNASKSISSFCAFKS